jgi:4-carboxymuconolactone decarboxylase
VCATVYGSNYEKLRANVRSLHPDVDGWMVAGGYGRVIGRPGLDLVTRELCIAALLAVWNVPRQLHSHLRGSLNAGATAGQVDEAVEAACAFLDDDRAEEVRALWGAIRPPSPPDPPLPITGEGEHCNCEGLKCPPIPYSLFPIPQCFSITRRSR